VSELAQQQDFLTYLQGLMDF